MNRNQQTLKIASVDEMLDWGKQFARSLQGGEVIFLNGELGAGKTTLTRGILQGLGHHGAVKSPTFTLVEAYPDITPPVFHFDLYRLNDPEELEFLGWRDYLNQHAICIVEWPAKAAGYLPAADIDIELTIIDATTRQLCITR